MKNLRQRKPYITPDLKVTRQRTHGTNAVMRAFGNSTTFPWGTVTRDEEVVGKLQECSLLFLEVEDDSVIDIINSFSFEELIFSRMTGETAKINPTACLISKYDILHCYEQYNLTNHTE
jgi:hypothetical protein